MPKGSYYEPGVGSPLQMLRLAYNPPATTPACFGPEPKASETARGSFGLRMIHPGFAYLLFDSFYQPRCSPHSQHVINPVSLTPTHKLIPAEPRVPSYDNASVFPLPSNLRDYPLKLLRGPRRGVLIGLTQLAPKQMTSTEYVRRSVTVLFVVTAYSDKNEHQFRTNVNT